MQNAAQEKRLFMRTLYLQALLIKAGSVALILLPLVLKVSGSALNLLPPVLKVAILALNNLPLSLNHLRAII